MTAPAGAVVQVIAPRRAETRPLRTLAPASQALARSSQVVASCPSETLAGSGSTTAVTASRASSSTPPPRLPDQHVQVHSVLQTARSRAASSPRLHATTTVKRLSVSGRHRGGAVSARRRTGESGAALTPRTSARLQQQRLQRLQQQPYPGSGEPQPKGHRGSFLKAGLVVRRAVGAVAGSLRRRGQVAASLLPDSPCAPPATDPPANNLRVGTFLFTPPYGDSRNRLSNYSHQDGAEGVRSPAKRQRGVGDVGERTRSRHRTDNSAADADTGRYRGDSSNTKRPAVTRADGETGSCRQVAEVRPTCVSHRTPFRFRWSAGPHGA